MVREEYEGFFSKAFMIAFGCWGLIRGSTRCSLGIVEGMLVGGSLGEGSFEGPFGGPFGGGIKGLQVGVNGSLLVVLLVGTNRQMVK